LLTPISNNDCRHALHLHPNLHTTPNNITDFSLLHLGIWFALTLSNSYFDDQDGNQTNH